MNNNQNFDGRKPFFNTNYGSIQDGFSNLDVQNNGDFNQYGVNQDFNPSIMGSQINSQDIPPSLDRIKDLNEAPVSEAPTMDALGPMNMMPENNSQVVTDPLSSYENGNISIGTTPGFNGGNNFPMNGNSNFYGGQSPQINSAQNMQMGFNQANQFQSQPFLTPQPSQSSQYNNFMNQSSTSFQFQPTQPQNFSNYDASQATQNQYNPNDFNFLINQNINQNSGFGVNENNFSNLNNQSYSQPLQNGLANNFSVLGNEDVTSSMEKLPPLPVVTPITDEKPEDSVIGEKKEDGVIETPKEVKLEKDVELEEQNDVLNPEKDYDIINESIDKKEEKPKQDLSEGDNELLELGIDDSYTEPDTLDIMEEEPEAKTISLSTEEVKKIVDSFKTLVEELKKSGDKIELEEFDFEDMYQLIIKIDKKKIE